MKEALEYLSIGLSVIPLGPITKSEDGKKDIIYPVSWKKYQTTLPTSKEVERWNYPNLGIITGKISNIMVLDLDSYKPNYDRELEKSLQIPPTPTSQTASGGKQCFFRLPENMFIKNDVCIGHEGSGIDIRG